MQKRLIISLAIISGLVWSSVIALLLLPNEQMTATTHTERLPVTVENKAPQDYVMLVQHLQDIRPAGTTMMSQKISSKAGITREWVNQSGKDKFSIDDLLASLEQEEKSPLNSEE